MKLFSKTKKATTQTIMAALVIVGLHLFGEDIAPGWFTWGVSVPALLIVAMTAAARLYDISGMSKRWFIRRIGMLLVAGAAASMISAPLLGYTNAFPTWRNVCLQWGFALAWLTTPNMPPWWRYISGEYKKDKGQGNG